MKKITALAALLIAGVALASTFSESVPAPRGMVTSPIAQRLNSLALAAETAYRRTPQATASDSTAAKAEIERALAKVVGQRTNMSLKIENLQQRDGKTVATGHIKVLTNPIWDSESQTAVEARRRDVEAAATVKLKPPITTTDVDRKNARIEIARQAYDQAVAAANESAHQRIPEALVEVEFSDVPSFVRVGMKASLMGWIRSATVSPEVKSGIAYASIQMTVVYENPVNAAFATSRPAPAAVPATRPAASTAPSPAAATTQSAD